VIGSVILALTLASGCAATADENTANVKDKQVDRYTVPEGDSAVLLKFIEDLNNFKPDTSDQFFEYRKKAPAAKKAAAEKILQVEKDPTSPAIRQAKLMLLGMKIASRMVVAKANEQKEIIAEIDAMLKATKMLSREELEIAFGAASTLEQAGNEKLAAEAYKRFGELFSQEEDELLSSYGDRMSGAARRIELPGNTLKLEGKLVDGTEFDWKSYRGKVVLVDFWATWCGPCIQEMPNVKKNYEKYHDKGFDVVGISLDMYRGRLEEFLKKNEVPWKTLFHEGEGANPIATYYNVMSIPTVILVDKQGKVVSLNVRGEALGRHLKELLGSPDANKDGRNRRSSNKEF
jgi:thiol-disulfide isomerase/thioredoxin